MLPPTVTLNPAASRIRPVSAVVVDFPFVPVMATTRPRSQREANSSSPMTGTPRRRAAAIAGCSGGTPGLVTTRSASTNVSVRWPPSSSSTPNGASASTPATCGCTSDNVTRAPRRASSSDAATPLRAAPATVTRLPRTSNPPSTVHRSPQLQRRQAEQREDDADNHETRNHLRFAPANLFEMVVERRHLEHALAGHLERAHLN